MIARVVGGAGAVMEEHMPKLRPLALASLAAVLTACGGAPPVPGGPASATIPPSGGGLEAFDAAGSRYRLTFPAGAVDRPTAVTLRPTSGDAGALAAFEVEPAGLVTDVAVSVEVVLAGGAAPSPFAAFSIGPDDARAFVPTDVQGSTLSADLRFFAVPPDGSGIVGAEVATSQGGGDPVAATEAQCAARLASMQTSFDALLDSNAFEAAVSLALTAAGSASLCGLDEATSDWIEQVPEAACARYEDLVLLADVVAADTYDTFSELVQPVMNWHATLDELGVACPGTKTAVQVIGEKFPQFLTFYGGRLAGLAFTADHDRLRDEVRKVSTLRGQASMLGLPAAETMLEQQVLFPLMDLLRDRSFDECVDTDDHYYLFSLLRVPFLAQRVPIGAVSPLATGVAPLGQIANFEDADVQADIQYCASDLAFEVLSDPDVPEELTDARREFGPGAGPGQHTAEAATEGPVEGHLVLRGPIERLRCGEMRDPEAHELVVRFGGTEVHRAANLDANPEVAIESALVDAGLDPTGLNVVDVAVLREGGTCGGLYGGETTTLFTVAYTADPAPNATGVSAAPGALVAEQPAEFTFTLPWGDPGENLATLHMSYDLGGAVQTETIDLASSDAVSGFEAGGGTGTYRQTLNVFCSEEGTNTIVVTAVLEDAYGQRSDERQTNVSVTYGGCPAAGGAGASDHGAAGAAGLAVGGAR